MSRTLKKVPWDFNWPLNKIWEGYLNPYYQECPDCENGYTTARIRFEILVRLLMMSGDDAVKGTNHPYFTTTIVSRLNIPPSKDMAELVIGLSEQTSPGFSGFDAYMAERKIIQAAGLDPDKWGICSTCNGDGIDPSYKQKYEDWEKTDPPAGTGFQMWEDVTEGSPQSPVFETLDQLCTWCEINATTFADFKASAENWKKMFEGGLVFAKEGNTIFF